MTMNKLFIIFILTLSIINFIFPEKEILLKPIRKTYMYDNFYDDLYPFMYSGKIIPVDEKTSLRLIDEIEYDNGFFGDVLNVEITEGYYKGMRGYILEENVALHKDAIRNNIDFFFTDDVVLKSKIRIDKYTRCRVLSSYVELGKEVMTLQVLSDPLIKGYIFEYNDKSKMHFLIDKSGEISYYMRRGLIVIKIIDPENFLPIKNAEFSGIKSDEYGLLYIDGKRKNETIIIKKQGYSDGIVVPSNNPGNIFLCFMERLDDIRYFDDRITSYTKGKMQFEIDSKNFSVNDRVKIKTLSFDNLSLFCYPYIRGKNAIIKNGFFIDSIPLYQNINCKISVEEPSHKIIFFNTESMKWEFIPVDNGGNILSFNIQKNGYYLIIMEDESERNKISFMNKKKIKTSNIFIRNIQGNIYSEFNMIDTDDISQLPNGKYEAAFFSPFLPNKIVQETFSIDNDNMVELKYFNSKEEIAYAEADRNLSGLSNLFDGLWHEEAIKKNNAYADKSDYNILEFLGDMKILAPNSISFYGNDYTIEGWLEIVNNQKAFIHITNITGIVKNIADSQEFIVNPSAFNAELIIPVIYKYYVGIFQFSFNSVYFKRRKNYYKKNEYNKILMESYTFPPLEFPKSLENAVYKIFFSQEN